MKEIPITIRIFYSITDGKAKILQCMGSDTVIMIPNEIQGIPITEIGEDAFASTAHVMEYPEDTEVKTITHETYILVSEPTTWKYQQKEWEDGEQGKLLRKIILPSTVSVIGKGAFSNCRGLKQINLPDGVDTIADYAFSHCQSLKQIHLPKGIQKIGKYAFQNCRNLEEIRLPGELLSIGDYAFYNCRSLRQINLPQKLNEIGCGMFKNCESLRHISRYGHTFLQDILSDINQEVQLTLRYQQEKTREWEIVTLMFPDYEYEFVENHPARLFMQVNYGSGYLYRQCISSSDVDFKRYDELFSLAERVDTDDTIIRIALNRLRYPYRLFDEKRKRYIAYLERNLTGVAKMLIKTNDLENLKFIASLEIITEDKIDKIIDIASLEKKVECLSFLLDYKHTHFSRKERSFDL